MLLGIFSISTYAVNALSNVVFKDTIGAVELVKSVSDILTLVGSIVIKANSMLEDKPGAIN